MLFQTMNSDRSKSQGLKYKGFMPLGCKDKVIIKFRFVAGIFTEIALDNLILNRKKDNTVGSDLNHS